MAVQVNNQEELNELARQKAAEYHQQALSEQEKSRLDSLAVTLANQYHQAQAPEEIVGKPTLAPEERTELDRLAVALASKWSQELKVEEADPETIQRMKALESAERYKEKPPWYNYFMGGVHRLLGGFYGAAGAEAETMNVLADKLAKLGAVIPGLEYEDIKPKLFKKLRTNWNYYANKFREIGVEGIAGDVFEGIGGATWDIPSIIKYGPMGLAVHGGISGFAESGLKGMVIGGVRGAMLHKSIQALGMLPTGWRLPGWMTLGAAISPGEVKERVTGALTWAGLGLAGGTRRVTLEEFISRYPKIQGKIDDGKAFRILQRLNPDINRSEVKRSGGGKKVLSQTVDSIVRLQKRGDIVEKPPEEVPPEVAPPAAEVVPVPPEVEGRIVVDKEGYLKVKPTRGEEALRKMGLAEEVPEVKKPPEKVEIKKPAVKKVKIPVGFPKDAPAIWKAVMERGGIKRYKGDYLREEYDIGVPKQLRRKTGLPPDEMAAELGYDSDTALFRDLRWKKPRVEEKVFREEEAREYREMVARLETEKLPEMEASELATLLGHYRDIGREDAAMEVQREIDSRKEVVEKPPEKPKKPVKTAEEIAEEARAAKLKAGFKVEKEVKPLKPLEVKSREDVARENNMERTLEEIRDPKITRDLDPEDKVAHEKLIEDREAELAKVPDIIDRISSKRKKSLTTQQKIAAIQKFYYEYKPSKSEGKNLEAYINSWIHTALTPEGEVKRARPEERMPELLEPTAEEIPGRKPIAERVEELAKPIAIRKTFDKVVRPNIFKEKISEDKRAKKLQAYEDWLDGISGEKSAERLGITRATISNWRKPWTEEIRKIGPEKINKMVEAEKGKALEEVMKEVDVEVEAIRKHKYPKPGLAIEFKRVPEKAEDFKFNKEIEERYQGAKGIPGDKTIPTLKEKLGKVVHKFTRTFEYLPYTAEWSELKQWLKSTEKQKAISLDRTARILYGIVFKQDKAKHNLFSRSVLLNDLYQEDIAGRDLPFGFTKEILAREKGRLDAEVAKHPDILEALRMRKRVWDAIKEDYSHYQEKIGHNVRDKLKKEDYFRHQVLDHAQMKSVMTTGKRLRVPSWRGFLRERKGTELDINTDYLEAEAEVMAQMLYDTEVSKTIDKIRIRYDISEKLKEQAKKEGVKDWRDLVPEGYTLWQPREGHVFYISRTIPEKLAEQILEGGIEELYKVPEKLRKALSVGGKRTEWAIKEEMAMTLNDLTQRPQPSWVLRVNKKLIRNWKRWVLLSPRRATKYNLRNLTGDADFAFVGNPSGFKKVPQAVSELYKMFIGMEPIKGKLNDWYMRGGMGTTLQATEIGDLKSLNFFKDFYEKKGKFGKTIKPFKAYWRLARMTTDFREAILRYANYLDYLEQMEKDLKAGGKGMPKSWGASLPEEIRGLSDIKDRAFRLSNELLGAYDEISVMGQDIREHIFPFWSWKELNFRRYVRLFKNTFRDKELAGTVGRKVLALTAKSPVMALRAGRIWLKAAALTTIVQAYNMLFFPDVEADLPEEVKKRPHFIVPPGRDKDGKAIYFSRIGALGDWLEWFGMDAGPHLLAELMSGRKTAKEVVVEMAKSPVNQVVQGLSPAFKMPMEMATRRAVFPDVFNPRTIRNRGVYFARQLGLEHEYKELAGLPGRPYKETLPLAAVYKTDPLENKFHETWEMKAKFLKKLGKKGEGFRLTPRGDKLYYMKLSFRYNDKKGVKKYLSDYIDLHFAEQRITGKPTDETLESIAQGIDTTLRAMDPLFGLNQYEQAAFSESLDEDEKRTVLKAYQFYNEVLLGRTPFDVEKK